MQKGNISVKKEDASYMDDMEEEEVSGSNPRMKKEEDATHGQQAKGKNFYQLQTSAIDFMKAMIDGTIDAKLDMSSISDTFCVADLGCAVGPSTFNCVQNVIEAVENKFTSQLGLASDKMPEFQVFFNDLPFSDFNTLFSSVPPGRRYFLAGVPGSFHGQLFPKSSLNFVHCSYALQWLSRVPEEVLDKDSPAWNKGKIHYTNAPKPVVKAFASQFANDIRMFLDARAKELVGGGMMLLILPTIVDEKSQLREPMGLMFDHLGFCLMDMVKEEIICEDLVDSFNIPIYVTNPKEMIERIEQNGCFSIERIESTKTYTQCYNRPTVHAFMMSLRAGMQELISNHFGDDITDELFDRFSANIDELMHSMATRNSEGIRLAIFLKRKFNT